MVALLAASTTTAHPLPFASVDLGELQSLMARTYGERDAERGLPATVAWLAELANQLGIDLDDAASRYAGGCPKCGGIPCGC